MGDSTYVTQNQDGFKKVIDFELYLSQLKAELLGKKLEPKVVGKRKLPDGTEEDMYDFIYSEPNKDIQLVNEDGADYIIRNLRKVFNPHAAMGNIRTNREAAQLAGRIVLSIYGHIIANSLLYGCTEEKFSALEGEFDVTLVSVYNFFTALRDGGVMDFGKGTQKGNYDYGVPNEQPRHVGIFGR